MPIEMNDQKKFVYVNTSCGRFVVSDKDGTKSEYNEVSGKYVGHTIRHDPGKPESQVKPRDVLWVVIEDNDTKMTVKATLGTTFTWMYASHLDSMKVGDTIKLKTWPGTDVNKVSVCLVETPSGDGLWTPLVRREFPKDQTERRGLESQIIRSHAGWMDPETFKHTNEATAEDAKAIMADDGAFDPFESE